MPHPSTTLATLRPDLGGSLMEFDLLANQQRFIGTQVFPVIEAMKAAGTFGRVTLESLLASVQTLRASGSGYNRTLWKFEDDSYATKDHGAEEVLDDRDVALYSSFFDAEVISSQRAQSTVMTAHEARVAAIVQGNANSTALTGDLFSAHATATPVTNIENAVIKMYNRGVIANAVCLPWEVYRNIRQCAQVIERLNGSGAGDRATASDIGVAQLRLVFDLPFVFIAGGQSTASGAIAGIWDRTQIQVMRVATTGDIREPCIGRTIHWDEDGSTIGTTIEEYREEKVRGNIYRARMETDEKQMYAEACERITGVLS